MSGMKMGMVCVVTGAALICLASLAEAQQFATNGLIGFWTMDAETIDGTTVKDLSGNGYDGTAMGGPEPIAGKINGALHFDGVDDFVKLPDMGGQKQVTIEVWAYAEGLGAMNGLVSDTQYVNGTVHFKLRDSKISVRNPSQGAEQLGQVIKPETWYHFAYTSDADKGELNVYVDGEVELETEFNDTTPVNLKTLKIGDEYQGEVRFFSGILDEVRIYDRVLGADEIARNASATNNSLAVEAAGKLSLYWAQIKASM